MNLMCDKRPSDSRFFDGAILYRQDDLASPHFLNVVGRFASRLPVQRKKTIPAVRAAVILAEFVSAGVPIRTGRLRFTQATRPMKVLLPSQPGCFYFRKEVVLGPINEKVHRKQIGQFIRIDTNQERFI
jgi:hypothetical protein